MRKRTDPQGNTTPFSADDFKYRIDEFLSSGHDDHGQSVRLFFRCPPTLERELEVVRDSRRFPYQTVSDIIRHAVIRHAEWLHRMEPDIPRHFISGLNAINEICRDAEMLSQIQQTFAKLDTLIESHILKGELLEAQHLLSLTRGQLAKIPDSRWKRDFTEKFTRKYARHTGSTSNAPAPSVPSYPYPGAPVTPQSPGNVLEFPGLTSDADSGTTDTDPDNSDQ